MIFLPLPLFFPVKTPEGYPDLLHTFRINRRAVRLQFHFGKENLLNYKKWVFLHKFIYLIIREGHGLQKDRLPHQLLPQQRSLEIQQEFLETFALVGMTGT